MYASLNLVKNSKSSRSLVGTHQRFDKIAYRIFSRTKPRSAKFPSEEDILYFEGGNGPDGLKRKSPGVDEPEFFIDPKNDNGELFADILDYQQNLKQALKDGNETRAAFFAAWLAHAVVDGLTPAHHYPYLDEKENLMAGKDFVKIFGSSVKGIMRGDSILQYVRNNWLYWGAGGLFSKHMAYEFGVALTVSSSSIRSMTPKLTKEDVKNADLKKDFYAALEKIDNRKIYDRFRAQGWTADLALETRQFLAPELIRMIALAWASALKS
jgi:hypothetical protein